MYTEGSAAARRLPRSTLFWSQFGKPWTDFPLATERFVIFIFVVIEKLSKNESSFMALCMETFGCNGGGNYTCGLMLL